MLGSECVCECVSEREHDIHDCHGFPVAYQEAWLNPQNEDYKPLPWLKGISNQELYLRCFLLWSLLDPYFIQLISHTCIINHFFVGHLFPVNERATRTIRNLYVENERVIMISRFNITWIILNSMVFSFFNCFFINSSSMTHLGPFMFQWTVDPKKLFDLKMKMKMQLIEATNNITGTISIFPFLWYQIQFMGYYYFLSLDSFYFDGVEIIKKRSIV